MSDINLPNKIRSVIGSYVKAFSDKDLDAVCALYADDATVEDPVGSPRKVGGAAIRDFYTLSLAANPQLKPLDAPSIAGAFSATPISATVTMNGRDLVIEFISVMSFHPDGLIKSMTAYFDPSAIDA